MSTIHSESPVRDATKALIEKIKDVYDLRYSVTDLKPEIPSADEAWVTFTQITERTAGPQFRNNRVKGVHIFKKEGGHWKFYDSKVIDAEYLQR
jgi:hypothetical protein